MALATKAVEVGYWGYFTTADDTVVTLVQACRLGNWASKLKTLTTPTALVIDDVGLLPMERGRPPLSSTWCFLPRCEHP